MVSAAFLPTPPFPVALTSMAADTAAYAAPARAADLSDPTRHLPRA